jgi:hypothetical protein
LLAADIDIEVIAALLDHKPASKLAAAFVPLFSVTLSAE